MKLRKIGAVISLLGTVAFPAFADIERHPIPGSDFPILQAATLENVSLTYLSGTVPQSGENGTYGDTEAQTVSVFSRIQSKLEGLGLKMDDIVKMTVFLVPEEDSGRMDFEGFMKGYTQFFGTESQPNLPTRSVVGVADLANPEWLVEIEVVAAKSQ